jgi:hypothetical protein
MHRLINHDNILNSNQAEGKSYSSPLSAGHLAPPKGAYFQSHTAGASRATL